MDRFHSMATFIRVVETGSFSAAARQLNVGQPAVSKIVAQLESRLQTRLLTRSTHGLMPTEAGQRFYERARVALQEADEAELAARGAGKGLSGKLRISAATTFARLHIIPQLPRFLEEHPELNVDVILDDRVIDLIAEGIDISLRMGNLPDSSAVARKLATSPRSVIATPGYLTQKGSRKPRLSWQSMRRSFITRSPVSGRSPAMVRLFPSQSADVFVSAPPKDNALRSSAIWACVLLPTGCLQRNLKKAQSERC